MIGQIVVGSSLMMGGILSFQWNRRSARLASKLLAVIVALVMLAGLYLTIFVLRGVPLSELL